jgi:glyceraldehyde-3-phosphate dehydrogenase/erythrose-4-phosphate dehydrogenase
VALFLLFQFLPIILNAATVFQQKIYFCAAFPDTATAFVFSIHSFKHNLKMTKKRIAINGFGRIGRLTFRNLVKDPNVEVVAINDLTDNQTLAHLLKYDTMQGRFEGTVSADENSITVNGTKIAALAVKNPAELPWAAMKVDVVLECTGIFLDKEKAGLHLQAGAKRVILSAPLSPMTYLPS